MTSMTGLVLMAWIQSKFSNIGFRSFPLPPRELVPPGAALLRPAPAPRRAVGRDGEQLLVARVLHEVAVRGHGLAELLPRLVQDGAARHRGQALGVVAVGAGQRHLVGLERAIRVALLLAGAAEAERGLDL